MSTFGILVGGGPAPGINGVIGAAAMLSRAVGGITRTTAIFALPGSTKAVRLGIDRLIGVELGHILGLIKP